MTNTTNTTPWPSWPVQGADGGAGMGPGGGHSGGGTTVDGEAVDPVLGAADLGSSHILVKENRENTEKKPNKSFAFGIIWNLWDILSGILRIQMLHLWSHMDDKTQKILDANLQNAWNPVHQSPTRHCSSNRQRALRWKLPTVSGCFRVLSAMPEAIRSLSMTIDIILYYLMFEFIQYCTHIALAKGTEIWGPWDVGFRATTWVLHHYKTGTGKHYLNCCRRAPMHLRSQATFESRIELTCGKRAQSGNLLVRNSCKLGQFGSPLSGFLESLVAASTRMLK